jgi:hypothetical protein
MASFIHLCHPEGMSGWLVEVPVKRSGGSGRPLAHLYAAWVPEPPDALDAVHRHMSDYTVKPETVAPLSDAALLGLGLAQGQVCRVQTYS